MARLIVRCVTMLVLLLMMALSTNVITANGQPEKLKANVPFDFIVGDKTLAAGQYDIQAVTAGGDALAIRRADREDAALRLTRTITAKEHKPALVFHRYGNMYFLSEVWEGGDRIGRRVDESRQERAIRRERSRIATNGAAPYQEVVVLATVR